MAKRLGLDPKYVFPAYEDTWYYLWRERKLPVNVDPFDARLADPLERDRIRKVFTQGLDKVVGHVLPVARRPGHGPRWQTGPWFLRAERCYLIPGDSPLGYRLPLDSQPWAAATDMPWTYPPDQTQPFAPLPSYQRLRFANEGTEIPIAGAGHGGAYGRGDAGRTGPSGVGSGDAAGSAGASPGTGFGDRSRAALAGPGTLPASPAAQRVPAPFESAGYLTRTALSAEPRHGRLYVFMPPMTALEDYLELVCRRRGHRARDEAAADPRRL